MTQQTELLRTAVEVLDKAASTLFVQIKASTDKEMVMLSAARTRFHEMRLMVGGLTGNLHNDVHPTLQPLRRAIEDVVASVGQIPNGELPEGITEEQLEDTLIDREDADHWLTQASVSGTCMLAHLDKAIKGYRKLYDSTTGSSVHG